MTIKFVLPPMPAFPAADLASGFQTTEDYPMQGFQHANGEVLQGSHQVRVLDRDRDGTPEGQAWIIRQEFANGDVFADARSVELYPSVDTVLAHHAQNGEHIFSMKTLNAQGDLVAETRLTDTDGDGVANQVDSFRYTTDAAGRTTVEATAFFDNNADGVSTEGEINSASGTLEMGGFWVPNPANNP